MGGMGGGGCQQLIKKTTKINIFKLIQQYPLESAYPGLVDIF